MTTSRRCRLESTICNGTVDCSGHKQQPKREVLPTAGSDVARAGYAIPRSSPDGWVGVCGVRFQRWHCYSRHLRKLPAVQPLGFRRGGCPPGV